MSIKDRRLLLLVLITALALVLAACGGGEAPDGEVATAECPEAEPCPACPTCPEPEPVDMGPVDVIPYEDAWASSPHNAADDEAFRHWDEDDPQEVPESCAKCHSGTGFMDFVGADGSEAGVVDTPHEIGTTITCEACHNDAAAALTSVAMPSGDVIEGLGPSARCMQCHQGRASGGDVVAAIAEAGVDDDTVSEDLGFINIHYYAAAASLFGSETHAGFEYEGNAYQMRFGHVDGYTECIDCHNQHTLEVRVEECVACHDNVTADTLHDIRMNGSLADYDGDGDTEEGVYYEIEGLREMLYTAMQAYAEEVAGTPLVYDAESYPYFFDDAGERYGSWTPRLVKAAYNYQVSLKDPGNFAHNAKYHVALLYDSIADLNAAIASPVDLSAAHRNDPGHFDGTAEAFRHWDEDGAVSGSCARCHSAEGLPLYIAEGTNVSAPTANGFACTTCHESLGGEWPRYVANDATFPSGATLTFGEGADANLCIQCHQGRSSSSTVDARTNGIADDTVDEGLGFINIHYFAAGATLFGTDAAGAYQYAGKEYLGRFEHVNGFDECTECHDVHQLEPRVESCAECHGSEDPETYREDDTDWDGDGDTEEGIAGEIDTMVEVLGEALVAYTTDTLSKPIVYNGASYPYFFDEAGERYTGWTPRLVRGAYNYQYALKDPGKFAHNGKYVIQILYDSIEDLGGDVSGMTRPAVGE